MGYWKISTTLLSVLFIMSCSSQEAPPPPKKTVFDPLLQSEQRARDVQNTVDAQAVATHKAVESQERGDSTP
jgi:hypothetical protein